MVWLGSNWSKDEKRLVPTREWDLQDIVEGVEHDVVKLPNPQLFDILLYTFGIKATVLTTEY